MCSAGVLQVRWLGADAWCGEFLSTRSAGFSWILCFLLLIPAFATHTANTICRSVSFYLVCLVDMMVSNINLITRASVQS